MSAVATKMTRAILFGGYNVIGMLDEMMKAMVDAKLITEEQAKALSERHFHEEFANSGLHISMVAEQVPDEPDEKDDSKKEGEQDGYA